VNHDLYPAVYHQRGKNNVYLLAVYASSAGKITSTCRLCQQRGKNHVYLPSMPAAREKSRLLAVYASSSVHVNVVKFFEGLVKAFY
jgi:hypothetical protein